MTKFNWSTTIASAYKLGQELSILGGISLEDFAKNIDTSEIESKAQEARSKLPKTLTFYRKKGAPDNFIEDFTAYIENYKTRSIGNELVNHAMDNNFGFKVDWKADYKDYFSEMKKIVPELPETLISGVVSIEPLNFIELVNVKSKDHLNHKMFVDIQTFNDSSQVLYVSSEGLHGNLNNSFINFQFAFGMSNINNNLLDLIAPYRRINQLINTTNKLLDYEGYATIEDLFSILVLLESAIEKSLGLVIPETEYIRRHKKRMNLKLKDIRDRVYKLSHKLYRRERIELLNELGNSIQNSWQD